MSAGPCELWQDDDIDYVNNVFFLKKKKKKKEFLRLERKLSLSN